MQFDDTLEEDTVFFELPTSEDVQAFTAQLRPRWPGWSDVDADGWVFTATLGAQPDELAQLLRRAQQVLADRGLAAIRFSVDGRIYRLGAAAAPAQLTG